MSSWSAPGGDGGPGPQDAAAPPPAYAAPYSTSYPPPSGAPYGAPYGSTYGSAYGGPPQPAPFAYGPPGAYGARPPLSRRWRAGTITQIVLSVLLTALGCGLGLPSLVLSIVAMTRAQRDGASARRLSVIGWVCFALALVLLGVLWTVLLRAGTLSGVPARVEDV